MKTFKYISFCLMALLVVLLVAASVVEHLTDTETARAWFYTSPYTILLWGVMAVTSLSFVVCRLHARKQWATVLLHVAFAVILCGALVTHLFGEKGHLELSAGGKAVDGFILDSGRVSHFPFHIRLLECHTDYYPGTQFGMDYVSRVELSPQDGRPFTETVSMNHILCHLNYRFYQTSIGDNRTVFTVTHDPWGIGLTYAGYALLLLAMLGFPVQRNSRFRALLSRRRPHRSALLLLLLLFFSAGAWAAEAGPRTLQRGLAKNFGRLHVYYNDRVCPVQTLARDFCVKLYGRPSYRGLTAEQVLTGWIFYYEDWKNEPMIRIKDKDVRRQLGLEGEYASLADFYDNRGYRLDASAIGDINRRPVQEASEKSALAGMVCTGSILKIYPCPAGADGGSIAWLSWVDKMPPELSKEDWKFVKGSMEYIARAIEHGRNIEANEALSRIVDFQRQKAGSENLPSSGRFEAELIYNRLSHTRPLAMVCLSVGLLSYAWCCLRRRREGRFSRCLPAMLDTLLGGMAVYLSAVIALRGYVSGHLPLSDGFETMQFMSWCSVVIALLFRRHTPFVRPFGLLLCGLSMLVAMMGEGNPQITHLMPVLASPLLSLHVVVIMVAYALLAIMALNSLTALLLHSAGGLSADFRALNSLLLCPALFLLAAGIFVGAVWANQSWGTYWSWDPKETWALVTLLVYAFPLHDASLPVFRRDRFFHSYILLAFATVLMTYFGVNFLLGGMHSYV